MKGKEKCPVLAPTTSQSNQYQRQSKGRDYFESELIRVEKALFEKPQTMKEVDRRIGVMRESICRYCAKLRKQDKLYPIRKRICNVTGHPAIEWSTNPALVPPRPKQLDLFTDDGNVNDQSSTNKSTVITLLYLPILSTHYIDFEKEGGYL